MKESAPTPPVSTRQAQRLAVAAQMFNREAPERMAEGDECSAQRRTSGLPCRAVSRERIETGSNLLTFGETLGLFAFLPSAKLKLPAMLVGLVDAFHRSVMTAIALVQL